MVLHLTSSFPREEALHGVKGALILSWQLMSYSWISALTFKKTRIINCYIYGAVLFWMFWECVCAPPGLKIPSALPFTFWGCLVPSLRPSVLLALARAFWDTRFAALSTAVRMESHVRRSDDSDIFQHVPISSRSGHEHLKRQKDARSTRAFRGISWYWQDFSGPFDPFLGLG